MSSSLRPDLIVLGATPGGITAAIAAAREGRTVLLLERSRHIGGLPANGLGATDIATRGVAGGLFKEFTARNLAFYVEKYGADSGQVRDCGDGFHFEPSVAEGVLEEMLAEHPSITVLRGKQFDADAAHVDLKDGYLTALRVRDLASGAMETYAAPAFIDATYEGDLAGAAGVPFSTRREGTDEYGEFLAGRVFQVWQEHAASEGSTGEGDDTLQAFNYRLCLTDRADNRVPIPKPDGYDRAEYASLAEDLRLDRKPGVHTTEREWDGIGRITNIVWLPNGKTDANNQHLAFISTDLPEENYPWPTADWAWRDRFALRLRNYILGLFWFLQNDPEVPESFRENARRFGLAADEYTDNGHFPRQVYVREGRRIAGEYNFIAHDAVPVKPGGRPPVHADSITASHYAIDSHAVRKREPGRGHLDGFVSYSTAPYTVPYGVILPKRVENLWVPVAVSASHLGFGTLRMEPCWMAMGEAAGAAAALALSLGVAARSVPVAVLQRRLLARGVNLFYLRDVALSDPAFAAAELVGLRGGIPGWDANLDDPATDEDLTRWAALLDVPPLQPGRPLTRREALIGLTAAGQPALAGV